MLETPKPFINIILVYEFDEKSWGGEVGRDGPYLVGPGGARVKIGRIGAVTQSNILSVTRRLR